MSKYHKVTKIEMEKIIDKLERKLADQTFEIEQIGSLKNAIEQKDKEIAKLKSIHREELKKAKGQEKEAINLAVQAISEEKEEAITAQIEALKKQHDEEKIELERTVQRLKNDMTVANERVEYYDWRHQMVMAKINDILQNYKRTIDITGDMFIQFGDLTQKQSVEISQTSEVSIEQYRQMKKQMKG